MRSKLTAKQKIFVQEYCLCHNASEAARLAGYSLKSFYDEIICHLNMLIQTLDGRIL